MQELLAYISKISLLEKETFKSLEELFQSIQLKKNNFFSEEGQIANRIGFLQKGVMRAYFLNQEGKEYTKQFFVGQSIVGAYGSLLTKRPNKIAQQALTDCEILVANFADVEKLYSQYHDLERLGRKIAEYYFLEKEQKEIEMALLDADKRYVLFRKQFPTLESIIPQYYIASYLGISTTQLSRIRKKLRDNVF